MVATMIPQYWSEYSLSLLKAFVIRHGYRIEVDPDGTERVIRPDGTVAVIARRPPERLNAISEPPRS